MLLFKAYKAGQFQSQVHTELKLLVLKVEIILTEHLEEMELKFKVILFLQQEQF